MQKKYSVQVYKQNNKKKGKELFSFRTVHKRRLVYRLNQFKWTKDLIAYVKVKYGRFIDCWGRRVLFTNDGWYQTKLDTIGALRDFDELEREDF